MYISITLCLLCVTAKTVECFAFTKTKTLSNERLEPVALVATMGDTVALPGYLESTTQPFYKDNRTVYVSEHVYELKNASLGYQVQIRFLTCADEGTYRIGGDTFTLSAKADACGMFYYTAKVDQVNMSAFIGPLHGVIRISLLAIQPEDSRTWSIVEVWNDTMSRTVKPKFCCLTFHNGARVSVQGDNFRRYVMYQRHGHANASCSSVQLAALTRSTTAGSGRTPVLMTPDLKKLEDVKTSVKLQDMSESIQDIKKSLDELNRQWRSAGFALQAHTTIIPLFISVLTLMFAI